MNDLINMNIRSIDNPEEKTGVCKNIIQELPEWFDEKGRRDYPAGVSGTLLWACSAGGKEIGFISIKKNNNYTSEIFVLGVLREHQRSGWDLY